MGGHWLIHDGSRVLPCVPRPGFTEQWFTFVPRHAHNDDSGIMSLVPRGVPFRMTYGPRGYALTTAQYHQPTTQTH